MRAFGQLRQHRGLRRDRRSGLRFGGTMAETLSTMLPLGTPMPRFSLTDAVSGRTITSALAAGAKGTLVMFICNHCPFVKHVLPEIERLSSEYLERGLGVVAINSNDALA